MTILIAKITDEIDKAIINDQDCKDLDFEELDLVRISNEETNNITYCRLYVNQSIPRETIALGRNLMLNLGITEESLVGIEKCMITPVEVKDIQVEFDAMDYNYTTIIFDEDFKIKLITYLRKYLFNTRTDLYWPGENANLKITFFNTGDLQPPYQISAYNDEIRLKIVPRGFSGFNAILAIDCSGSMSNQDVPFKKMSGAIDNLKEVYAGETLAHETLKRYLDGLKPRYLIDPDKYAIKRIDAAFLAILTFFNQKMSRGLGEKCGIVLYSSDAIDFSFNESKKVFDSTDFTNIEIINTLKSMLEKPPRILRNITRFTPLFAHLNQKITEFAKLSDKPIMIIMLTDGRPTGNLADSDKQVEIEAAVRTFVKTACDLKVQAVLFTLGMGDEQAIGVDLMRNIAAIGKGEYQFAKNFAELTNWFENLAREFMIILQSLR